MLLLTFFYPLLGVHYYIRGGGRFYLAYAILVVPLGWYVMTRMLLNPLLSSFQADRVFRLPPISRGQRAHLLLLALYSLLIVVGFLRAAQSGGHGFLFPLSQLFLVVVLLLFLYASRMEVASHPSPWAFMDALYHGLLLYVLLNAAGTALGLTNAAQANSLKREFEVVLPVFSNTRLLFPFTANGQIFSIEAGLLALLGSIRLATSGTRGFPRRVLDVAAVGLGLVGVFGHGARAPMLMLLGCLAGILLWRPLLRRTYTWIPILVFALPLLFLFTDFGAIFETLLKATGIDLSRGADDLITLSNRTVIWTAILSKFLSFSPQTLFGYGAYGQIASGIVLEFSFLFEQSYENPESVTAHNTYLQTLLDYGYVGFLVLLVLLFSYLWVTKSWFTNQPRGSNRLEMTLVLGGFFVLVCSITEVGLSYYCLGIMSLFAAYNLHVALLPRSVVTVTEPGNRPRVTKCRMSSSSP